MGDRIVGTRRKMERQQTITSLIMIVTFILAWSPYAACVLILTIRGELPDKMLQISSIFAKTSTLYNPIIYSVFVDEFRTRCRKMFGCYNEPPAMGMKYNGSDINDRVRPGERSATIATVSSGSVVGGGGGGEEVGRVVEEGVDGETGRRSSTNLTNISEDVSVEDSCEVGRNINEVLKSPVRRSSTQLTQLMVVRNNNSIEDAYIDV